MTASAETARVVRAEPGAPFGEETRPRPVGRIGGICGVADGEAEARVRAALGPNARLLGSDGSLVADFDRCFLDDLELADLGAWRTALAGGRLGDVSGAFTIAERLEDGSVRLSRDALGERSLFYAVEDGTLVFASSLRALLASGLVARRLSVAALARYLTYAYLPGARTLVEGVRELLPGESVTFRAGRLSHEAHWSVPPSASPDAPGDEDALTAELRRALEAAVARRLPPRGEDVGAFLSGGLDSSGVVALARRLHEGTVRTYSISFGPELPNELAWSSMVAAHCGTDHTVVELPAAAVVAHLDDAIGLLSDPIGDPLTVPNALLFREAARRVSVVLNGEGGDPCFGGPKNLPMLLAELYGEEDDPLARERSYLRAHLKCYDDLPRLLTKDTHAAATAEPLEDDVAPLLADDSHPGLVAKLMAINVRWKGGHHILPKVDAESAPFGVLPRSPLFDRAVAELAFRIPARLKLRGTVEKYLLKRALADLLPRAILERPKSGMLVPVEAWFSGPLLPLAKERLLDGLAPYGLFDRAELERLLAGKTGAPRPRRGVKIWLLVTLEAWLRTVLAAR